VRGGGAVAREFREQARGKWQEAERLGGFCLLLKREVLSRIGPLEDEAGLGLFDTDLLSVKARQAGYTLALCRDLFVHHFGTRTFAHGAPAAAERAPGGGPPAGAVAWRQRVPGQRLPVAGRAAAAGGEAQPGGTPGGGGSGALPPPARPPNEHHGLTVPGRAPPCARPGRPTPGGGDETLGEATVPG